MDLSKKIHQKIFSLFIDRQELTYTEISNGTGLRSNLLQYYLKQLQKEGLLIKDESSYRLSSQAEYLIPFFKQMAGKERLKLPVVLIAVIYHGKILLLKRVNRPYQGYFSLPGGKILYDETILEAANRVVKSETGITLKKVKGCALLDEQILTNETKGNIKHGFMMILTTANPQNIPTRLPQNCDWFTLNTINCKIIPSDKMMIGKLLKKRLPLNHVLISEKEGKIIHTTYKKM